MILFSTLLLDGPPFSFSPSFTTKARRGSRGSGRPQPAPPTASPTPVTDGATPGRRWQQRIAASGVAAGVGLPTPPPTLPPPPVNATTAAAAAGGAQRGPQCGRGGRRGGRSASHSQRPPTPRAAAGGGAAAPPRSARSAPTPAARAPHGRHAKRNRIVSSPPPAGREGGRNRLCWKLGRAELSGDALAAQKGGPRSRRSAHAPSGSPPTPSRHVTYPPLRRLPPPPPPSHRLVLQLRGVVRVKVRVHKRALHLVHVRLDGHLQGLCNVVGNAEGHLAR